MEPVESVEPQHLDHTFPPLVVEEEPEAQTLPPQQVVEAVVVSAQPVPQDPPLAVPEEFLPLPPMVPEARGSPGPRRHQQQETLNTVVPQGREARTHQPQPVTVDHLYSPEAAEEAAEAIRLSPQPFLLGPEESPEHILPVAADRLEPMVALDLPEETERPEQTLIVRTVALVVEAVVQPLSQAQPVATVVMEDTAVAAEAAEASAPTPDSVVAVALAAAATV